MTLIQERGLRWESPEGLKVSVHLGLGLDSTAILCAMHQLGVRPDYIIFSDTGSEWPETYKHRDEVMVPWLRSIGFPELVVTRRMESIKVKREETLLDEIQRTRTLPSVAYGWHKCSLKFKAEAINGHMKKLPWVRAEWAMGRRIVKVIGYNAKEPRRAKPTFPGREGEQYVPYYPLFQWGLDRDDEAQIVRDSGLPVPKKSACWFCPHNTDEEWLRLRREHPELWEKCLDMERESLAEDNPNRIEKPDVVGLRRRGRKGERQLKDWIETL